MNSEENMLYRVESYTETEIDMSDYKDAIQAIFDELCSERYDKNYWELPDNIQSDLYAEAMRNYTERMADRADFLLDQWRERQ